MSTKRSARRGARLAGIVLAAGQGTRMRSARAKVLHTILGRPLLFFPVERARALGADPVVVVLGHQRSAVEEALAGAFPDGSVWTVEQREQRGTGHAARIALRALGGYEGSVLVLCGDVPLLRHETLAALCGASRRSGRLAILTAFPEDPTGLGRILRDGRGRIARVVEHRDASRAERAVREINAGVYAGPAAFFRRAAAGLRAANAAGEFYLTDVIARAASSIGVTSVEADAADVVGVNDRRQLAQAEAILRDRTNRRWMDRVTFRDPASTVVELGVSLAEDVELGPGVALRGRTRIGRGARIGDGVVLADCDVGEGAEIEPYCVARGAAVGPGAKVGPFAHLRPGTELGPRARVGNFVEMKKARLGAGSKANHLSYLGDATVGDGVNVGAGTITCNYDGHAKHPTVIEDGVFIGSDTQLVAPVVVRRNAVVAAGTTVTEEVPAGALAIARVKQTNVPGYAEKVARRRARGNGR